MRFFNKEYHLGDTREVTRFLIIPTIIGGEGRWLEMASIKQRYVEVAGWYMTSDLIWQDEEWINK